MAVIFGCFAAGRLLLLQQVGFGLAAAILIDAILVRLVLVPASMALLGRWNWYLPGWFRGWRARPGGTLGAGHRAGQAKP
jgi:RND superfamily putative drug exporter